MLKFNFLQQRGIVFKFNLILILLLAVFMLPQAAAITNTTKSALTEMTKNFVDAFKSEREEQEKVLDQALRAKGDAVIDMLAQVGGNLIGSYDFEGLERLAGSAVRDGDIVSASYVGKDDTPFAKMGDEQRADIKLRREIKFGDDLVGYVNVGLSSAGLQKNMEAVNLRIDKQMQVANEQKKAAVRQVVMVGGVMGAFVLLALVIAAYWSLSRLVMGPVGRAAQSLGEGADQVSGVADGELSSSSQALAEGASQQAAAVEEMSASLNEVAAMTRRDAENIGQAAKLMSGAGEVIGNADGSMKRLVSSMDEIAAASSETQKIVKTIDEIAFQTNLLALNAAVEAARAGEAGAGFAVVADEVRNLAMRAAEAARNTSELIDGTVSKIKGGSDLVAETSESFGVAAQSIGQLSTLINEINQSSNEQARAVSQVTQAIGEIDQVTQKNAATAEESAAVVEELSAQAEAMVTMVQDMMRSIHGAASPLAHHSGRSPRPAPLGKPLKSEGRASAKHERQPASSRRALPAPTSPKAAKRPPNSAAVIPFDDDDFQDF